MTHNEIEQYLKDKDLNTFEYQLAMDAMLFAEQKTIERACELLENNMYYHDCGDYDVITCSSDTIEEMISDFKKSMEE
jgi:hypothetical protein